MTGKPWRPADEAEAVGGMAVFVEWLRATGRMPAASPAAVQNLRSTDPPAFRAAVAAFAGLDAAGGVRAALLRHRGPRPALVTEDSAGRTRTWSRDDVQADRALPPCVATALAGVTWPELVDLAATHLLDAGTRPGDRVVWTGDPSDPWPYGAWIAGATVVLAGA
jgi:hypothetical protein